MATLRSWIDSTHLPFIIMLSSEKTQKSQYTRWVEVVSLPTLLSVGWNSAIIFIVFLIMPVKIFTKEDFQNWQEKQAKCVQCEGESIFREIESKVSFIFTIHLIILCIFSLWLSPSLCCFFRYRVFQHNIRLFVYFCIFLFLLLGSWPRNNCPDQCCKTFSLLFSSSKFRVWDFCI